MVIRKRVRRGRPFQTMEKDTDTLVTTSTLIAEDRDSLPLALTQFASAIWAFLGHVTDRRCEETYRSQFSVANDERQQVRTDSTVARTERHFCRSGR